MIAPSFGQELLERYGSPLYVYDLDEAERQAKALFELLPKSSQVLYSVKANPIPELCAALRTAGCRVEIASPLELKVVLEAGFAPDQILCSGPGKTAPLVREMLLAGVTHFSCDSWYDLERLAGVARRNKEACERSVATSGFRRTDGKRRRRRDAKPLRRGSGGIAQWRGRPGRRTARRRIGGDSYLFRGTNPERRQAGRHFRTCNPSRRTNRSGRGTSALLDLGGGFPWPFGTSDAPVDISALREKLQRVNALSAG